MHIWHQDRLARFHKLNYKVFILLNFKKKKLSHKGKKEIRHGIHHCYAIGWSYSDNRARPKGNYAYLLLCFVFFVLIYVSLYVFVPFLHNVSRETPPSELLHFFLKFFWINVIHQCTSMYIHQCTYWSILLTVVFALELIHLTWYKLCDNFISGKWIKKTFQKIGKALAPVSFFNSGLPYKPGAIFVKKIINIYDLYHYQRC